MPPLRLTVIAPSLPAQVGLTGLVKVTANVLLELNEKVVSIKQLAKPLSVIVTG